MGFPKTDLFHKERHRCTKSTCPKGQYLCHYKAHCINIELICDGINHCYQGDDEIDCGKQTINFNYLFIFICHEIFTENSR